MEFMAKILLLLVFMDSLLIQLVFSQYNNEYSNNEGFNPMYNHRDMDRREDMVPNQYNNQRFDGYNQQYTEPYEQEYKPKPMPYQFEYNTDDGYGNKQDRQEKADENGYIVGSYGYMDSNGIYRKVYYTAGPDGFKARINSNEPFLKKDANPADVMLFVEDPPQTVLNFGKQQPNSYSRNNPVDSYEDFGGNQMIDQNYRESVNRIRVPDKRYVDYNDNGLGRNGPHIEMLRPQQNTNKEQDYYPAVNTFSNHGNRNNQNYQNNQDDSDAYATKRKYLD